LWEVEEGSRMRRGDKLVLFVESLASGSWGMLVMVAILFATGDAGTA